jgi:GNAT superfamily N-acetyltransferase
MPQLRIFTDSTLPEAHEHQIRSFIRLHWHDEYQYNIDGPLVPPERHPTHLVMAERHALFSHARVIWVPFSHAGETWRLYCLGDVFTYPAFRRRGFGAAVTAAGTERIQSDTEADVAILFCDPDNADFYARHGWVAAPDLRATRGFGKDRDIQEGLPMLLILSERARDLRPDQSGQTWELPGYGW